MPLNKKKKKKQSDFNEKPPLKTYGRRSRRVKIIAMLISLSIMITIDGTS